jgi:hypothetical protein
MGNKGRQRQQIRALPGERLGHSHLSLPQLRKRPPEYPPDGQTRCPRRGLSEYPPDRQTRRPRARGDQRQATEVPGFPLSWGRRISLCLMRMCAYPRGERGGTLMLGAAAVDPHFRDRAGGRAPARTPGSAPPSAHGGPRPQREYRHIGLRVLLVEDEDGGDVIGLAHRVANRYAQRHRVAVLDNRRQFELCRA